MKHLTYLFSLILFASCTKKEKYAEIGINKSETEFVEVRNALDDVYLWDMKNDTIYPNEENEFLFKKNISSPEFATIKIGDKWLKAILLPESKIEIDYVDSTYVFKGENHKGLELLNDFKRPFYTIKETNKYKLDTTATQIKNKIKSFKEAEFKSLQELIDNNQVAKEFADLMADEINSFYALRTQEVVLGKQYEKMPIKKELIELFNSTLKSYPLNSTYKSSNWLEYVRINLQQKSVYDLQVHETITRDSIQKLYKNDHWNKVEFDLINNYKNPSIAEKASANFIINTAKQKNFEKSLLTIFEDFKNKYPNSVYTPYLQPEIKIIEDYFQKIEGKMPEDVAFIDGAYINTMDELMEQLKGDKYYVDVWATWCAPCKREFKHNDELNDLLKAKGYKKLYISLDEIEREDKWKQDIKYYNLNGLHLLANLDFFKHFEQNYSTEKGYVSIPQYLIIDENGNIVTNDAPRPSHLDKLENML
ncbi:thiol-disulfide isomerase/thioredoxin [Nonlabens dokdonensis]|uniref:Alkyl hydroperoxide reductase/ Thiol specific antioxidant/ Mal allergen n=2 Tax=Nonlabens dokdonensis TaxID=328515 RepID=L7WBX5_NONDD|nr:TlpA disulfide reductase family protein [Nonlabens dokdonensis]AGC76368.1 alkyl hydroperoxide reductase/ Thiol specific antioxidant/ Mal allergen [Nonlabens dokdonensis DSW-6]PZX44026.1 thiol-disulfide isomerase/thioredoxin [Nonlabens dokdonensis]